MSYSLIVKPEAELDMLKSAKWYEEKQVDLGIRFQMKLKIKPEESL
jgi:hypothetical protein